ncbi:winged helix DNA-binding domain-containing protein [Thermoclostridium stercorarium]|uniref:crosslink repair DNA glycosylase YcaQ family protein n=1 Tax=Thermoclostridium stercorarium TaxID=1510 RepID=UPI000B3084E2|nr:crosslink repair DNA glycosylase YcaQ family protein [Thermoclostridium stercorarium]UZQ86367.1 winged helix DNA-binding domain-containing protein [Thermoclostridium stercorarium]
MDRKLIKMLFGFDYKWEAYTPKSQRKYGYYVLPMLYGDRFIEGGGCTERQG